MVDKEALWEKAVEGKYGKATFYGVLMRSIRHTGWACGKGSGKIKICSSSIFP